MPFNFNNNLIDTLNKFNQFKNMVQQSKQNPAALLEQEIKRRNMSEQDFKALLEQAKSISSLFGIK